MTLSELVWPDDPRADDMPAVPRADPGQYEQLTRLFAEHPTASVIGGVILASIAINALLYLAYWCSGRIAKKSAAGVASDTRVNAGDEDKLSPGRQRAKRIAAIVAGLGSVTSWGNTLVVFWPWVDGNLSRITALVSAAIVLEMLTFVYALSAIENVLEYGRAGTDRLKVWLFAATLAVACYYGTREDHALGLLHMLPALAAASAWAHQLTVMIRHYRAKNRKKDGKVPDELSPDMAEVLWRRVCVFVRLADDGEGVNLGAVVRRHRVSNAAKHAYLHIKAEGRAAKWHGLRRRRAVAHLQTRYGRGVAVDVSQRLADMLALDSALTRDGVKGMDIWTVSPTPTGSGSSGTTGGGAGNQAPAGSGNDTGNGTSRSTGNATGGPDSGTTGGNSGEATTLPPVSPAPPAPQATGSASKPAMTWAEVKKFGDPWSSSDRFARKLDIEVALRYAAEVGRKAAESDGTAIAGMRAYFLAMRAAGYETWNWTRMYREITGKDSDPTGQGSKAARKFAAELHADVKGRAEFDHADEELAQMTESDLRRGGAQ